MSNGLVVGIFPSSDPTAIESALGGQQIDLSKVKIIRRSSGTGDVPADSQLRFVDVERNMESNDFSDDMTKGMGIIGDSGGTSVPGIRGSDASLEDLTELEESHSYLGGVAIPDDEIENFNEAIDDGRAVVAYPAAGESAGTVAAAFKAAGLRNVRTY